MNCCQESSKSKALGVLACTMLSLVLICAIRKDSDFWEPISDLTANLLAPVQLHEGTITMRSKEEPGYGSWFDGCRHVYLDVGSNMGIQIRKLFEPDLYPGDPVLPLYDHLFGTERAGKHKEICAVGFEPNIHHTKKLQELESAYQRQGWRVKIFTDTAAATKEGSADFFFDNLATPEHHEWGASMIAWQENMKNNNGQNKSNVKTTVQTTDLARYVLENVATRKFLSLADDGESAAEDANEKKIPPAVLMKMDIEGSEHELLPHMIITGALCKIDTIFYEDHSWGDLAIKGRNNEEINDGKFADFFKAYARDYDPVACPIKFASVDNEKYGSTDFPLPAFLRRSLARRH